MYIKKIMVQNFRQLKDVELELQENTTILAGPNNSGKTSFILLLKRMFSEKPFVFSKDDINAYDKSSWSDKIYNILKDTYEKKEGKGEDQLIKEICDKILPIETDNESKESIVIPELTVKLQIDYTAQDDISNFANYIMDLDKLHNSFYFVYKIILNRNLFEKGIKDNWNKISTRLDSNKKNSKKQNSKKQPIIEIMLNIYCSNLVSKCYFADKNYKSLSEFENIQDFKILFNFKYIGAARPVDDSLEKDKRFLSKALLSLVSKDDIWKTEISKLPDKVFDTLDDAKINDKVDKLSTEALNSTIESISKTNGGHTGDLHLNLDVSEKHIEELIQNTTNAKYSISGNVPNCNYNLNETSQGLGYSNLIYMHTQIEDYIKSKDSLKVNLLIIEEPESHMHPQMQYVFTNKLLEKYDEEGLQGLITTHSSEIVRGLGIEKLRVIREETLFNSKIYNLSSFINNIKVLESVDEDDGTLINDFKSFYENIGISEIIFADVAILFEGDTERLYLKKIISLPDFIDLQQKYIAYIQVGGAYAYKFKYLLEFLKIKSLIITDIDYDGTADSIGTILNSQTTNSTIKKFYYDNVFIKKNKSKPQLFSYNIEKLYKWIKDDKHIVSKSTKITLEKVKSEQELIYLAFQTEKDNYTRTLEAAMLSKKFGMFGYDSVKRSKWKDYRAESKLKYSIPKNRFNDETNKYDDSEFNLIDILNATSNGKTDFMCSVIINKCAEEMLPDYIKEGLKWLMK